MEPKMMYHANNAKVSKMSNRVILLTSIFKDMLNVFNPNIIKLTIKNITMINVLKEFQRVVVYRHGLEETELSLTELAEFVDPSIHQNYGVQVSENEMIYVRTPCDDNMSAFLHHFRDCYDKLDDSTILCRPAVLNLNPKIIEKIKKSCHLFIAVKEGELQGLITSGGEVYERQGKTLWASELIDRSDTVIKSSYLSQLRGSRAELGLYLFEEKPWVKVKFSFPLKDFYQSLGYQLAGIDKKQSFTILITEPASFSWRRNTRLKRSPASSRFRAS